MTHRAEPCLQVLHALDRGDLLMAQAAEFLGRSVRQVRRLRATFRIRGPAALVHGNRGRPSVNRIPDRVRARVVRLATTVYVRVNDHHFQELLTEREGLVLSRSSIRRILRAAGGPSPRRRRPPRHRRRRERMPQEGLIVQLDGSTHAWLDQRGPRLTLIATMDDATGEVPAATLPRCEGCTRVLPGLSGTHPEESIPVAAYSDRHGIFYRSTIKRPTFQEQLAGTPAPTQVARALHELSIRWIPASSPQAKGRIERLFGTFQDRLCAELRLADVADREEANAFLADFLPRYNARFAQPPASSTSAYRPWPSGLNPQTVFCFKYQRVVSNDNTVTLGPRCLQLLLGPGRSSYAKATVDVHERLDGSIAIFYQGRCLAHHTLTDPPPVRVPAREHRRPRIASPPSRAHTSRGSIPISTPTRKMRPGASAKVTSPIKSRGRGKYTHASIPAADHPWRYMLGGKPKQTTTSGNRT